MTTIGQYVKSLEGIRVAIVGRLAGMPLAEAAALVRQHGGTIVADEEDVAQLIIVGEADLPLALETGPLDSETGEPAAWPHALVHKLHGALVSGQVEVISESEAWRRLGQSTATDVQRLYTAAMLAELLGVSVSVVRRWRRLGLIRPVQEVRKLAYYDFREVMSARRLAQLLAGGVSPARLKKQLDALRRVLPSIEGPLAQLTVIVEGKDILLRQGAGLIDAGGQMRFDFEAAPDDAHVSPIAARIGPPVAAQGGLSREHVSPAGTTSAHQLPAESATLAATDFATLAVQLEDAGRLAEAAEMYRAALAAAGPRSELCFALAELLYRLGDLAAARERYYMAIELDEDFVEARANLGCVLAEQGQLELAAAAFEGALRFHPDYADVHFHLARTLCKLGHPVQAAPHWSEFLRLAPHSPWSDEARQSLHGDHPPGLDSS